MKASSKAEMISLYEKYYIDRDYEQVDLFQLLKKKYEITNAVYPGSYVQISPSFVFPYVAYIDADRKAKKFFNDTNIVVEYISKRKEYRENPNIDFYEGDYRDRIVALKGKFDLLISQYAGFISDCCKGYLRIGGYLLVNNSHGDAGLASIDKDYKLISTVHKSNNSYRLSTKTLDKYFIPKKDIIVTKDYMYETGKGVGYSKTATLYIFRRVS